MKMKTPHYNQLNSLIRRDTVTLNGTDLTLTEARERYTQAGLSDKRFRWDMFWAIAGSDRRNWFDTCSIYNYLDDTHIDTALRAIMKERGIA